MYYLRNSYCTVKQKVMKNQTWAHVMAWYFGCKFSLLLDKLYHTACNSCEGDNIKHNVCCSPRYLNQKSILKLVNRKDRQILLGLNFHIGQGLQISVR